MKILKLLLIICLSFIKSDDMITSWTEPMLNTLKDSPIKVYSMVWSGKYYNPSEVRSFFFAIPFSFNTFMTVDTVNKNIHLEFPNFENAMEMFRTVKEEAKKAEKGTYNKIITFSDEYTKIDLNLDFAKNPDYALSLIKPYENQFAKSIQIKITMPNSKIQRALYVTFDLAKGEVQPEVISSFMDFLNKLKKQFE